MSERADMEVIEFGAAFVTKHDHRVIVAVFNGAELRECVAVLKCSEDAARALMVGLSSALTMGDL